MTMSESDRSSDANDEDDLPIFKKIRVGFQNPNVVWTNTPGPRPSFRGSAAKIIIQSFAKCYFTIEISMKFHVNLRLKFQ